MHAALTANLTRHTAFGEDALAEVAKRFTSSSYAKNEHLFHEGHTPDYFHYIAAGVCRTYTLKPRRGEATLMFALPDWWITDMDGFTNATPANVSLQALSPVETLRIHRRDFDELLADVPDFGRAVRHLFQRAYIREQRRVVEMMRDDASTRYRRLVGQFLDLEQVLSQKHIASYLGITPEFLSALKRES